MNVAKRTIIKTASAQLKRCFSSLPWRGGITRKKLFWMLSEATINNELQPCIYAEGACL